MPESKPEHLVRWRTDGPVYWCPDPDEGDAGLYWQSRSLDRLKQHVTQLLAPDYGSRFQSAQEERRAPAGTRWVPGEQ